MYQVSPKLSLGRNLNVWTPVSRVISQFSLFTMLFRNDLTAKFRHSVLGVFWLFIPPLCILLIYVYMFSVIFKLRWPESEMSSNWGFGLAVYTGITVFSVFCDSVMGSLNLLVSRGGIIKRVPFPWELLPVSFVCANVLIASVVLLLLFGLSLLSGGAGSWMGLLYFPLVMLPLFLFTLGCSWLASAAGVFFRDLSNLMGIIMLLLFFSTPVFYSIQMIPDSYLWMIRMNPLTPAVLNIRGIFLQNQPPDWGALLLSWIVGLLVFQIGFCCFEYLRRRFADVI